MCACVALVSESERIKMERETVKMERENEACMFSVQ
jgi:hypothetical protein